MQKIEQTFQKGLKSLEEINILGGQDLSPLVGAANHHFSELKRKALESIDKNQSFEKLNQFLASHLEAVFNGFIKQSKTITQAQIFFNDTTWGNKEWNNVINIIPEMLNILELLNVSKNIQLLQEKETFTLRGWIRNDSTIEENRAKIYSIFRKLLSNKVLMTYSLNPDIRQDESIIEVKLDLSHDDNKLYSIKLEGIESPLCFSNIFSNYVILDENKAPQYKHHILTIDKDINLNKFNSTVSDIINKEVGPGKLGKKVLIHFPFLFQPLSLILPKEGIICMKDNEITNNYIDIFNLLSITNETEADAKRSSNV